MFHNLFGYVAHLFIKGLGKKFKKEKYISYIKINVKLAGMSNKEG